MPFSRTPYAGGVTGLQWSFIAYRLLSDNDMDAAKRIGINVDTVSNWRNNAAYVEAYQAAFSQSVDSARAMSRAALHVAAQRLAEALDATKTAADGSIVPDHAIRLQAAKLLLQGHGVLSDSSVRVESEGQLRIIIAGGGPPSGASIDSPSVRLLDSKVSDGE